MLSADEYQWKLILFFSADIVGSTEYKPKNDDWRDVFQSFYNDFPATVRDQYQDYLEKSDSKETFQVWKYLGDEVLLYVEVISPEQALEAIGAFASALGLYAKILKQKSEKSRKRLGLKGTTWTAGFPVMNKLFFEKVNRSGASVNRSGAKDFIGPGIDLGFRLTKFSSEEKLIISVDVAYLLLEAKKENNYNDFYDFHCDGESELKGVNEGKPYPVIWLNLGRTQHDRAIERLCHNRCGENDLRDVCDEYYKSNNRKVCRPFIVVNSEKKWGTIPKGFEHKRQELIDRDKKKEDQYDTFEETENESRLKAENVSVKVRSSSLSDLLEKLELLKTSREDDE
jgi:hypothetical protein